MSHISFILGLAIDYISSQCLVLSAAPAVGTRNVWALLANTRNMPKQVKISATEVASNEANQPQVFNLTLAGGRRYDVTTREGENLEGAIVLFREPLPVMIDGEEKSANKKWFALTTIVDALIMSIDDGVAAKAANVLEGDFMSLRGLVAQISIYTDDEQELHYKLEF